MVDKIKQRGFNIDDVGELIGTDNIKKLVEVSRAIGKLGNENASILATEIFIAEASNHPITELNMCTNAYVKSMHRHFKGDRKMLQQGVEGIMHAIVAVEKHDDN